MKITIKIIGLIVAIFSFHISLCAQGPTEDLPGDPGLNASTHIKFNQAFPNPCKGNFKIHLAEETERTTVRIYNWQGIVVTQQTLEPKDGPQAVDFSLPDNQAGRYVVEIKSASHQYRSQLLVQR